MTRKRLVQEIENGLLRITEITGEIHISDPNYLPTPEGFNKFFGTVVPCLTQHQIDTTPLPVWDIDRWDRYPEGNEKVMPYLGFSHNFLAQSIIERIGKIKIAEKLGLLDHISDDSENN